MKKFTCILSVRLMFVSLYFADNIQAQNQKPVVKTPSGDISGVNDEGIFTFKGIPYAKAERFMPPQLPDAWEGVRECTEFGPVAKQIVAWIPDSTMDENKLFSVNVWTKGLAEGKKRLLQAIVKNTKGSQYPFRSHC